MKRFVLILCAVCLLAACAAAWGAPVLAENETIETQDGGGYQTKYLDMLDRFNNQRYDEAMEFADDVYKENPQYEDILRYYKYLHALNEMLPQGKYKEAYDVFSLLSTLPLASAYASYAQGMQKVQEGILGDERYDINKLKEALDLLQSAADAGINRALEEVFRIADILNNITPHESTLKEVKTTASSLTISWADMPAAGPFTVTWCFSGTSEAVGSSTTDELQMTIEDLLPDTTYTVKVAGAGNAKTPESASFTTLYADDVDYDQAHGVAIRFYQVDRRSASGKGVDYVVNNMPDKRVNLNGDGFTPGKRKPSNSQDDFYIYVSFSAKKLEEETPVRISYALRSDTDPVLTVGKTEGQTLVKGKLNHGFYSGCLTDLMDLLYDNGGLEGDALILEVYMDGLFMGSQVIEINRR